MTHKEIIISLHTIKQDIAKLYGKGRHSILLRLTEIQDYHKILQEKEEYDEDK